MGTWEQVFDRLVKVGSKELARQRAEIIAKGDDDDELPVRVWETMSLRGERVVHAEPGSPGTWVAGGPHGMRFIPAKRAAPPAEDPATPPHPLKALTAHGQAEDGSEIPQEIETKEGDAEQVESRATPWFGLW